MRKAAFSILFISFIFSIINSISYINKFDKNFFQNNNSNNTINNNNTIKIGKTILTKDNMVFRSLPKGNSCKIFIQDIQQKSDMVVKLTDELKKTIKEKYVNWLIKI